MKFLSYLILFFGLFLNGCGPGKSHYIAQNFWDYSPPKFASTKDFHLVLVWKEFENKIHHIQLAHPEWFVEHLAKDCSREGVGKLRSYQIINSPEELYPWMPFWKPDHPTVRADAYFSLFVSTSEWKVNLQVQTNYQPFPTAPASWGPPTETTISRKLNSDEVQDMELLNKWIKSVEPELYEQSIRQLISSSKLFQKWNTYVYFLPGKSPGMKEAFELSKKGDWKNAKQIWLKELEISKNDPVIYLNLSATAQMQGQWEEALDYFDHYSKNKPQGFVWLFSGLPIEDTYIETLKGLSLYFKYKKNKNRYHPNSKLAILLLDNITNNLDIPEAVRKTFLKESRYWGHSTLSLEEVDQTLLLNGFTDGGQLASTTPQVLGKMVGADLLMIGEVEGYSHGTYSLVYASSGETILTKRVSGLIHTYSQTHKVQGDKEVEKEYVRKRLEEVNRTKILTEIPQPNEVAARSFFRSWPRLYLGN